MGISDRNLHQFVRALQPWAEREKRFATGGCTTITKSDGSSGKGVIHNLSGHGARIATELPLQPGDRITFVAEPLGLVMALVRWTDTESAGVEIIGRDPFHSDYRFSYPP